MISIYMNVVYMYFDYMVLWMIHNLHDHISYQVNKDYSDDIEQRPWHECQCNVGSILGLVTSSCSPLQQTTWER